MREGQNEAFIVDTKYAFVLFASNSMFLNTPMWSVHRMGFVCDLKCSHFICFFNGYMNLIIKLEILADVLCRSYEQIVKAHQNNPQQGRNQISEERKFQVVWFHSMSDINNEVVN